MLIFKELYELVEVESILNKLEDQGLLQLLDILYKRIHPGLSYESLPFMTYE